MFDKISQIFGMFKNLPKMREEMQKLQERLGQITAEGDAGGGMVKARFNGRMELIGLTLSDDAMALNDREMLEDLIRAATNQAVERVRQQTVEETRKLAGGFGLPPGMDLPGLT